MSVKLKEIIGRLEILSQLAEEAFKDSPSEMELVMIDRADVEAFREATAILDDVAHVRRLMGREDE